MREVNIVTIQGSRVSMATVIESRDFPKDQHGEPPRRQTFVCGVCGAMVIDFVVHERFHEMLESK